MATDMMNSLNSLATSGSTGSGLGVKATEIVVTDTGRQVIATERLAAVHDATAERVEISQEAIEKVVSELKDYVQNSRRNLDFQVDDVTGRVVVKVIDSNSDTVIRQIPSEEILALSRRLAESVEEAQKGMLLELKA